jgi:hypothetical protein
MHLEGMSGIRAVVGQLRDHETKPRRDRMIMLPIRATSNSDELSDLRDVAQTPAVLRDFVCYRCTAILN